MNYFLLEKAVEEINNIPDLQVVVIGVGTVFFGLVSIVLLCKIIGWLFGGTKKATTAQPVASAKTAQPIENRQQIIAAVSAVIAEELGTDVSAIRIKSFKKL